MPQFPPGAFDVQLPQPGSLEHTMWANQIPEAFRGILGDALQQHVTKQADADALWQQLQGQMATPTPQMDPNRAFMAQLMGGISQALAPQMGGGQMAQQGIAAANEDLKQRKAQTLAALHDRYKEAAEAAEAAGDTEKAIKMRSAELKVAKDREEIVRAQTIEDNKAAQQFDLKKLGMQLDSAERIASNHDQRALDVAQMQESVALARSNLMRGEDGTVVPLPSIAPMKEVRNTIAQYITAGKEKGLKPDAIRTAVKSAWATPTTEDGEGADGMRAYAARLTKQFPTKLGLIDLTAGAKPYSANEMVTLLGGKFLIGEFTTEDARGLVGAMVAAGYNRQEIKTAVDTYAASVGAIIPSETWQTKLWPKPQAVK